MAWIELHQELRDHPKAKRLARTLGIKLPHAIGHLTCLWMWAFTYAQDGDLSAYTADDIAEASGWDGDAEAFLSALAEAPDGKHGFIERPDGKTVFLHDWHRYGGKLIAKKDYNARNMRAARAANNPATLFAQDGTCKACGDAALTDEVTRADHVSNTCIARVPLEERRGEKKRVIPPKSPKGVKLVDEAFEIFWIDYPNKTCGKAMALKSWLKHKPNADLVALIMAGLEKAKASQEWHREAGKFVPMCTTWLNQSRWTAVFEPPYPAPSPEGQAPTVSAYDRFSLMAKMPERYTADEIRSAGEACKAERPDKAASVDAWLTKYFAAVPVG